MYDWLLEPQDPCCNTQLQTSFKPKDSFMYPILAPYSLLYEAVFDLKEDGFKLDVTRVGPKLIQSVIWVTLVWSILCIRES